MAEVVFDGSGTPVEEPNIDGAEAIFSPGGVIFTNDTNPKEVEYLGFGDADGFDHANPEVEYGATNGALFTNATNPTEESFGGVGEPVADGNQPGFPVRFDNKSKNATLGAPNAIFDNSTSPTEAELVAVGLPVGDGNQPNFPVNFDNVGKNVTIAPAAGAPVGNDIERKFITGPVLNFNR